MPGVIDASVLVFGGGAARGVTAAPMAGKVRGVTVLDANREHVARMRDPGLEFDELGSTQTVRLDVHATADEIDGSFDLARVTLKAPALETALPPLRGRAAAFVSLGNGLVQERVASLLGEERVLAGTVELGATHLGPGRLRQTTRNPYVIGDLAGGERDRVEDAIDTVIGHAGATEASVLQDIRRGLATEVDVINGAVVARAAPRGLEAPLNARIVELIHSCERGEAEPSAAVLEELGR